MREEDYKMAFWKKKEQRAEENVSERDGSKLLESWLGTNELTRTKAMEISAVSACVRLIGDKIATVPLKLYEKKNGEVVEITDDVRVRLLNGDTGDTLNATEMRREWVKDYFLEKGAYSYIERDMFGNVKSLRYVKPQHIAITWNEDPIFKSYEITVNGNTYFPYEFLKICRNNDGHGRGRSIIAENNLILSVAYNTMKFENVLVKKGGNKKGFLKAKQKLAKEAMDALKAAWAKLYDNDADNDNVIVLNDGVDFAESSNTSVEMQLNENKQTNMQQICSLFCTPYDIITGKASPETQKQWVKNCIIPLLNVIEAAVDSDLLTEAEKESRYFAFDTAELTRGDFVERMNGYAVALQNNILDIDEVRAKEDYPPRGFNFMKLGLQDVLLDLKTNRIYTPNTNQFQDLGAVIVGDKIMPTVTDERANKLFYFEKSLDNSENSGIIKSYPETYEMRYNHNHCPKTGRFTSGQQVKLPDGTYGSLANGGKVTKIVKFAGAGTNKPVKVAVGLSQKHKNKPSDWGKYRGDGYVLYADGLTRHVELHWFESPQTGVIDLKVKREF